MTEKKRNAFHGFSRSFYRDHSKKIILRENGKMAVEYVYEGIYYTLAATEGERRFRKLASLALSIVALSLLLRAMSIDSAMTRATDITLLEAVCLLLFLGLGVGIWSKLTAPVRMTRWEYRMAVATVRECALGLLVCLGLTLLDGLISLLMGRFSSGVTVLLFLLACWGAVLALFSLARGEQYTQEVSQDLPSGTDITNDFNPIP